MYDIRIEKNGIEVSFSDEKKGDSAIKIRFKDEKLTLGQIQDLIDLLQKTLELITK